MNNTGRFDGKAEIYSKARPGYPGELFDFLGTLLPEGAVVADVGSGTGIFTELLLMRGCSVRAVEPNADMRRMAEERLGGAPGFVSVNGTDSHTTLEDGSVDCVVAAQAFHWFDAEGFKRECRRILKPRGYVVIVYNTRDGNAECSRKLAEIHRRYCPEFRGFSGGMNAEKIREFFEGECEVFQTDNSRVCDRGSFVNRALSSSYSLSESDGRYAEYVSELHRLFDELSDGGTLTVPVYTTAYSGRV